jgi:hypothetical protein
VVAVARLTMFDHGLTVLLVHLHNVSTSALFAGAHGSRLCPPCYGAMSPAGCVVGCGVV